MPIHRTLKNVVKNYTLAEVKVREATSNDPWGPSTSLMSEIADLTFNVMALAEIMNMIWKRLNDHGKNWRHVYKSLVLLDYLLKTGSERVAQQSRENLHSIQSLKDFQYLEDGKDHGSSIREKSKQIVVLLKDEERFKNERTKALTAKERFAQNTGMGSTVRKDSGAKMSHSTSDRYLYASSTQASGGAPLNSELEAVRPSSFGEEDLQLQLALAMSKEEHEEEQKRRKGDELKLQMAIEESRKITETQPPGAEDELVAFDFAMGASKMPPSQTWDGHLSVAAAADPWAAPAPVPADPWGLPPGPAAQPDRAPPLGASVAAADPWSPPPMASASAYGEPPKASFASPWEDPPHPSSHGNLSSSNGVLASSGGVPIMEDEFDLLSNRYKASTTTTSYAASATGQSDAMNFDLLGGAGDPWDVSEMKSSLNKDGKKKTAEEFLGANANLVNLNDLVTAKPPPSTILNPFGLPTGPQSQSPTNNLFAARAMQEEKNRRIPINQMQGGSTITPGYAQPTLVSTTALPAPLLPAGGWPMATGVGYQQQPIMQPQSYPQNKNPFQ